MRSSVESADAIAALPAALRWAAGLLFVISVPLFLILGSVLDVAGDRQFYARQFATYGIGRVTGLDDAQLQTVAERLIEYLRDPEARLDVVVNIGGQTRPLFNQKEIAHMEDVQRLFTLVRRIRLATGAILLLIPLIGLSIAGGAMLPRLGILLAAGGILTIALLVLAGLLSLVDFSEAFVKFHELAFSNDLWMLDPRTDYLIMLFPEGFWFDATMRIAMQSAVQAVVLAGVGVGLVYFGRRR